MERAAPVRERVVERAAPVRERVVERAAPVREGVVERAAPVRERVVERAAPREVVVERAAPREAARPQLVLRQPGVMDRMIGGVGERLRRRQLPRVEVEVEQQPIYRFAPSAPQPIYEMARAVQPPAPTIVYQVPPPQPVRCAPCLSSRLLGAAPCPVAPAPDALNVIGLGSARSGLGTGSCDRGPFLLDPVPRPARATVPSRRRRSLGAPD